jgi:hypothetical protein
MLTSRKREAGDVPIIFFQLSYNRVPFTLPDKPVPDVRPYPPFGVCATDSRRAINSA